MKAMEPPTAAIITPMMTFAVPGKIISIPPKKISILLIPSIKPLKGPATPQDMRMTPKAAVPITQMMFLRLPIKSMELSSAKAKGKIWAAILNIMEKLQTFQKLVCATMAAT